MRIGGPCKTPFGLPKSPMRDIRHPHFIKEVQQDAQNLPTQEKTEKKGAWFQKENENC